jgi:hypothetical protein
VPVWRAAIAIILSPVAKLVLAVKYGLWALDERVKPIGLLAHPVQPLPIRASWGDLFATENP